MECTPDQLRKLIKASQLTQVQAAEVVGVNARTMRRYVLGELPVPRAIYLSLLGLQALANNASRKRA